MKPATVLLVMGLAASVGAWAQSDNQSGPAPDRQAARAAFRKACQDDMKSLCPDKQGRQMVMCLRSNNDKLSSECQQALAQLPQRPPRPPANSPQQ